MLSEKRKQRSVDSKIKTAILKIPLHRKHYNIPGMTEIIFEL